ncbi:hypothetical protein F5Y19DRAFT_417422 [Xylariaceae sp. FL1651]|nr:hypothetical protein F5Y19DRAFT_417422 [Xylariaceae sp. FL1651]
MSRVNGTQPPGWITRPLYAGFDIMRPNANGAELLLRCSFKIPQSLGVVEEDIDPQRCLMDYGVDPLIAIELRDWVSQDFRAKLSECEFIAERL